MCSFVHNELGQVTHIYRRGDITHLVDKLAVVSLDK